SWSPPLRALPMAAYLGPGWCAAAPDRLVPLPDPLKLAALALVAPPARADHEAMREQLDALLALALRHADSRFTETPVPRLVLTVTDQATGATPTLYQPMLCLVLQGAKEVLIGERLLRYDPASYFIATLEVAACGRIAEACPGRPFVAAALGVDRE